MSSKHILNCLLYSLSLLFIISLLQVSLFVQSAETPAKKPDTGVKVPVVKNVNDACVSTSECGAQGVFCNGASKCACAFGFQNNQDLAKNLTTCKAIECGKDSDCGILNSKCLVDKKTCACADTFSLDPQSQRCSKKLTEKCSKDIECGPTGTKCVNSECKCQFGYSVGKGKESEYFSCNQVQCKENSDCDQFGLDVNQTWCRKSEIGKWNCGCFPPTEFVLNDFSQKCQPVTAKATIACKSSENITLTCGPNSVCSNSKCECEFGFAPDPKKAATELACQKLDCTRDEECGAVFKHSKCFGSFEPICTCRPPYDLDVNTRTCVKGTDYFAYGMVGAIAVMAVGPILFFTLQRIACGPQ